MKPTFEEMVELGWTQYVGMWDFIKPKLKQAGDD